MDPINWASVRAIGGSQSRGFELLCAQLARKHCPENARFVSKAPPDGGVECFAIQPDGSEWGWQAKYFNYSLTAVQWKQVDDSARRALATHPHLVRYYVCVPRDRSDARVGKAKSELQKWEDLVRDWTSVAAEVGRKVEFVYWGESELLEQLSRPENAGRVRFWFGSMELDSAWFQMRAEESVQTAGKRYRPDVSIDLPIVGELEAFGRSANVLDRARMLAVRIGKAIHRAFTVPLPKDESAIGDSLRNLQTTGRSLALALETFQLEPVGDLAWKPIESLLKELARGLEKAMKEVTKEDGRAPLGQTEDSSERSLRALAEGKRRSLQELGHEIRSITEEVAHLRNLTSSQLLVLSGGAGVGKTHLLCDFAMERVSRGLPTVLLMGQRFLSDQAPWTQVRDQLDLGECTADEFVGALESAAESIDCRALFIVDALNEGEGWKLWPSHLAAVLTQLRRSPWIGVVLSVRTSFLEFLVPEELRRKAVLLTHEGFAGVEFDAAVRYFEHYGLEIPSSPLLSPEYSNPLFLSTLCEGLAGCEQRRAPAHLGGIRSAMSLYVSSVNQRLARALDFNPASNLVQTAIERLARRIVVKGTRWLPVEEAEEAINSVLPGRTHQRSLFGGMVSEGVLLVDTRRSAAGVNVVSILTYERYLDHAVAGVLLDDRLDTNDPAGAFADERRLGFLALQGARPWIGLLEALAIQVPERVGFELLEVAPYLRDKPGMRRAFLQSLIWRTPSAVGPGAVAEAERILGEREGIADLLDVLVEVAAVPGHALNASFLDQFLRRESMAERDAWWSPWLARACGPSSPIARLVKWGLGRDGAGELNPKTLEACCTCLSWMLSTSNRRLRDRATKALVCLLTGRSEASIDLVRRFVRIDDPYIAERVLAAVYGAVCRSSAKSEVGPVARTVFDEVFSGGEPPRHLLLRDYARGIVERALALGVELDRTTHLARPPWKSSWQEFPPVADAETFRALLRSDTPPGDEREWSRKAIIYSVSDGDFGRYVIGTNSGATDWLAVRLREEAWKSAGERAEQLVDEMSEEERMAWAEFKQAEDEAARAEWFLEYCDSGIDGRSGRSRARRQGEPSHRNAALRARKKSESKLFRVLESGRRDRCREVIQIARSSLGWHGRPRFDLREIQRFVMARVFELGWTVEHFGDFDRFEAGFDHASGSKIERIGKKYQWIALHEALALVSDHFQFKDDETGGGFEGPWQIWRRDIDPTCTMLSTPANEWYEAHDRVWWAPEGYSQWDSLADPSDWVSEVGDLPDVVRLLDLEESDGGERWLVGDGTYRWKSPVASGCDPEEVERRELWYRCIGYLLHVDEVEKFRSWTRSDGHLRFGRPAPLQSNQCFLGEHPWSTVSRLQQIGALRESHRLAARDGVPSSLRPAAYSYGSSLSGFDASVESSFHLSLPSSELTDLLKLRWSGQGADYLLPCGNMGSRDPSSRTRGPSMLLLKKDALLAALARADLTICWVVQGEKRVIGPGFPNEKLVYAGLSGAFILEDDRPAGSVRLAPRELDT